MSRHSKNNTSSAVFTSYERSKVKSGTEKQRVGHDSLKPFDACTLTLEPVVNPVADPQGHIYSKPAIIQYLFDQKALYKQALKAYNKQQECLQLEDETKQALALEKKVAEFDRKENALTSPLEATKKTKSANLSTSSLNSFWSPSNTPEGRIEILKKPSKVIKSPFGHPISLKLLVPITLTPLPSADLNENGTPKIGRYMCPSCQKCLNNATGVICIKVTGHVFCSTCMDKFIKKDGVCPLTGTKFDDDDLLVLESEGTGYSGRTGTKLVAVTKGPVARFG